jgi:hypothetical protein
MGFGFHSENVRAFACGKYHSILPTPYFISSFMQNLAALGWYNDFISGSMAER